LLPSGIDFLHFKSDLDLQNDTFPLIQLKSNKNKKRAGGQT